MEGVGAEPRAAEHNRALPGADDRAKVRVLPLGDRGSHGAVLSMLRGELLALLLSALLGLLLAAERIPRVRAHRYWPALCEALPVLTLIVAAQCAAHWFTAVSEIRPQAFLPSLAAAAALALPTAAVTNARARRIVAGVTIVLLSFLALSDALYYRFFGAIVPLLGTSNAKQAWNVTESIAEISMTRDLVFLGLLGVGGWLSVSRGYHPIAVPRRTATTVRRVSIAASALGILVLGLGVRSWLGEAYSIKIFTWRQSLHEVGLYGSHVRDLARRVRAARKAGEPASPERVRALGAYLESARSPVSDELFGVARGKNLILMQVEAMQEWVIDTRVRGAEITPFLNRLKRERGLYFSGVWDQTSLSPTADSEYLTLNSLHPLLDAAVVFRFRDNDFVALPGILVPPGLLDALGACVTIEVFGTARPSIRAMAFSNLSSIGRSATHRSSVGASATRRSCSAPWSSWTRRAHRSWRSSSR